MGYVAILPFLRESIAAAEDIPDEEKTPEYWAERLGREWCGLPAEVLAEKLLPFFREFNRLCEGEKKFNLVQPTASPADPQCDQLHAARTRLDPNAPITIARIAEDIFAFRGMPMSYAAIEADPSLILAEAREAYREFSSLRARIHALETALDRCLIGGNHIAGVIIDRLGARFSSDYPPGSDHAEVRAALTSQEDYEIWCCWNALMCTRSVLSEKTAGKAQEAQKASEGDFVAPE